MLYEYKGNGNLRDPFFPSRRSNCPCPAWAICVLHTSSSLKTKNPHFILLKDAFLERCDATNVSTNKNPTVKCCFLFSSACPESSPQPHDPALLPTIIPLLSHVLLCCWTCQRPPCCLSSTQTSIFLLRPLPRSAFTSLMAPLLHCNK